MTKITQPTPWWHNVEPQARALARKLCANYYSPDQPVLPYEASSISVPNGTATLVASLDIVPIWTCYVTLAREALAARDSQAVEAVVTPTDPDATAYTDLSPDQTWREEHGLDEPQT